MSSVDQKRGHVEAMQGAYAFRALFPNDSYDRWEFAGSLRRKCQQIGDVEHVIIPRVGMLQTDELFAKPVNLLFAHLDKLVAQGTLTKHLYASGFRWGEKYRGCDQSHSGTIIMNEIFCAQPDNWGSTLAIRTGPAEFSQRLVTSLRRNGFRNHLGSVWQCDPCQCGRDDDCKKCGGTGLICVDKVVAADECAYFRLCGMDYVKPEDRR